MAQRKPSSPPAKKSAAATKSTPATKPAPARKSTATAVRKPGKSIVNQKQTPWGLITTVAVLVIFAAVIVVVAVANHKSDPKPKDLYHLPEVAAAKAIKGIQYKVEPNHKHVTGTVTYDADPPTGGDHSGVWATCDGTIYDHQLANENAVHMLEHGSIWITYNPKTIKPGDLTKLKSLVDGVTQMALTPYANLKTPISLQAWGYQLFLNSASDPRIPKFIDALRSNKNVTPEYGGICTNTDGFVASKSYPGHPYNG